MVITFVDAKAVSLQCFKSLQLSKFTQTVCECLSTATASTLHGN